MAHRILSKRAKVRALLARTGLTAVRWHTLGRGLYCFNYHRIGDPEACAFDRGVYSCSTAHFREHVAMLKERFEVVNLARLLEEGGRPPRKPLALITFDDGYADNYEVAFPTLRELGVTAAFFIPTAFIGGSQLPWWDEIAWSLRNATIERIRLEDAEGDFDLGAEGIERSIEAVLERVKLRTRIPMDEQVREIRARCRPAGSMRDAGARLFMDREQLREMRRAGMDIGSHTHSHRILSHLNGDTQREELEQSKTILEGLLDEPITSVAYPVGRSSSYTPETCQIAESLGYRVGFNFICQSNRLPLSKPFDIFRFGIHRDIDSHELKSHTCFQWI
ncbi:Polysaccharide deacetylase [Singulisphaera sp. GP187]|uniref:polysaccharide deacetylase family protein n=1 Tax=Singulisphaera sp. GP187 TaxID=1882752 RepID=UPI000927B963|nr:polysaccharide deacetylase family protein [Singulisphaera sp. GP187]SIO66896.1 Polysaccharide deacetylase [Singulisphaera sp. GP187]